MGDAYWHGVDLESGKECTHNHHNRDHAIKCAESWSLRPGAKKCYNQMPRCPRNRARNRMARTGALMEYMDDGREWRQKYGGGE